MKIDLDEFCAHWTRDKKIRPFHSLLAKNSSDFVVKAGAYALSRFRTSFAEGGLYGTGQKWSPRTSKWGRKFSHPIMIDQGELKNSIKGEQSQHGTYSTFGKRDYQRSYKYNIYTTEVGVAVQGKRGARRGRFKNYAAVHNTDPSLGLYTVNQYSNRRPVQRQFIGHSEKLLEFINRVYLPQIFNEFPPNHRR